MVVVLKDDMGRPAGGEVTLWLVDEAVLSFAKEGPLDPLTQLIVKNQRITSVRDSRNLVLGKLAEQEEDLAYAYALDGQKGRDPKKGPLAGAEFEKVLSIKSDQSDAICGAGWAYAADKAGWDKAVSFLEKCKTVASTTPQDQTAIDAKLKGIAAMQKSGAPQPPTATQPKDKPKTQGGPSLLDKMSDDAAKEGDAPAPAPEGDKPAGDPAAPAPAPGATPATGGTAPAPGAKAPAAAPAAAAPAPAAAPAAAPAPAEPKK